MKKLKSKRFLMSIIMVVFLSIVTMLSVFKFTEIIGSAAITGILTITTGYVLAETKRSSKNDNQL